MISGQDHPSNIDNATKESNGNLHQYLPSQSLIKISLEYSELSHCPATSSYVELMGSHCPATSSYVELMGQGLRSINASGNPLLAYHCGNLWLLKWQQKTTQGIEKEGHREEGTREGGREEVEEGEMREENRHATVRKQGGQKTRIETEAKTAWEADEREGKEGTGKTRTRRRREKREGWTQDTRETSQVLTTEDCPSPGNSYSGCYLCAASLRIVNETGSGPCRQFILTCSVSGEPKPHIEWDIPPHLTLLHHDIDNLSASYITSTAKFALNMTEIDRARYLSPLACVASNEMYVSVEKINIDVDLNLPRSPVVCLAEYINTSPTILYFETQAAAPWNITWWFYPCVGNRPREVQIPLYTHPTPPGSSSGVGYFKFQDTPPTGHYEILLSNAYGNSTKRRFISNRPPNSVSCQDTEPVAIHVEEQTLPPVTQMPPTTRPTIPPCSAPSSTTTTTTTASTTWNAANATEATDTTDDSLANVNSPSSSHGVSTTTTPIAGPTHLSISIVLTIVAGVMVVVIGVTWLLLRNLRWPRDRSNMDSDPCPDSPFQINFM
ncbi:uncharacterized protein LOC125043115 [Penaeus chinensis]|uniref:uncharacterized protein LOC125043115 n=1 Tax=Penaeus chinensis TaxID=139456 RepID=UPI001FB79532|nr:uncharacterized protein LOC125043115 [Penaeus chinensis]